MRARAPVRGSVKHAMSPAHVLVDEDAAVFVEGDAFEEACRGVYADAGDNHVRLDSLAALQRDGLDDARPLEAVDDCSELELDAALLVRAAEASADLGAERRLEGLARGRDHRHVEAARAQRGGRLHADEARADDDNALRTSGRLDD
jgi:hypothetical protein